MTSSDPVRTSPRIRPGRFGEIGPIAWVLAHGGGRVSGTEPLDLFRVLGRHRPLFRGWLHFAGHLMPGGKLPRRDTELVVLRVAHLRDADYEWQKHVPLARRAGLTETDVERVTAGPDAPGWTPRQRSLLAATDALVTTRDVDDATWDAVRAHLDERGALELVLLAGHYDMLAAVIAALRIRPERVRTR